VIQISASGAVKEGNGAGPVWTTITACHFCVKDMYNPGSTYKVPVPAAGTIYSYWKSLALEISGTYTTVDNIKIYTDGGGFGAGITVKVGDETIVTGSYVQATGTEGETGVEMVANHGGISASTDFFTYNSGAVKSVTGSMASNETLKSSHVVLQMEVTSAASAGDLTDETITWRWDET